MKIYSLIFLISLSTICFAQKQDSTKNESIEIIYSPGVLYQKQFFGDLSLIFRRGEDSPCNGATFWGTRIGSEFNFNKSNFIIAPKVGYELDVILVCFRGSALYYFENSKTDLRLLPEIGIFGIFLNLTYGYSFSILKDKITDISNSRITLTLNISEGFGAMRRSFDHIF